MGRSESEGMKLEGIGRLVSGMDEMRRGRVLYRIVRGDEAQRILGEECRPELEAVQAGVAQTVVRQALRRARARRGSG